MAPPINPILHTLEVRCAADNRHVPKIREIMRQAGAALQALSTDDDLVEAALYSHDFFMGHQDLTMEGS